MNKYITKIFALGVLSLTSNAFATGFALPGGVERGAASAYETWTTSDSLALIAVADNSYHCRSVPANGIESVLFASTMLSAPSTKPTITQRGTADGGSSAGMAFSFTANASGTYTVAISSVAATARAKFSCFNTTLFGNFNTVNSANPVNYLEVKNISNVSIDATVIVRSYDGTEITRFNRTLTQGERQDIGLHDLAGVSNTFGSVVVTHNGGVGAIVANVSKYTFDGATLSITATEPLSTRVQN